MADTLPRRLAGWWRRPAGWWRRRGLRARVTITAAVGLLIAFAAADAALFTVLRVSLTGSVDDSARQAATEVASLINANQLPSFLPLSSGTVTIQVLDASGRISYVSYGADRLVPLLSPARAAAIAQAHEAVRLNGGPYDLQPVLRVAVVRANGGDLVIAAAPYTSVADSLGVVEKGLLVGTPLLLILFTGATWLATGSTLRPIALLRRGAGDVTLTGVPRDLPVPEAKDEVRSLALTLNDMLSRLARAQQRQRDLVSDTAHELRSPIASIRTQLEVALDHPAIQDWAATARDVHADTLRLARLAEDLLVLARLDERAGTPPRGTPAMDLGKASAEVVCRYGGARVPVVAAPRGDGPRGDGPRGDGPRGDGPRGDGPPVLVAADAGTIDRVLVNLIDNAVRYAKSRVTVTVRQAGGWGELTVSDDGPGIPGADTERAFDRFVRLDEARSRDGEDGGGAGLGLAIVRASAQAYGGTAHLEPAEPSGLRAVVRLPGATDGPSPPGGI